jgi:peroxiredoxin
MNFVVTGWDWAPFSYDSPDNLEAFSRQYAITFPLLSDAGSATIKPYGILNKVAEEALGPNSDDPVVKSDIPKYVSVAHPNASMVGRAFPGTFLLNRQGRVRSRFFEGSGIAPGDRFALVLEVKPGPGIHVTRPERQDTV